MKALNKQNSPNTSSLEIKRLTTEQKKLLQLSEDDIKQGRLISQDEMIKRNLKWLNKK